MDLQKILSGVKSLNDYIAATERVVSKCANIKIHLNMSTVLNLKKVRSLEIEYFNKCEDVGAAFVLFERMLSQPPSKTWALLGKELSATILYWLDAVRKHLMGHSPRWWTFLETILKFIRDMKSKDPSLPGIIVEQTTECLLDLSCNNQLSELQRHGILQTINECSAECSRELRLRMKERLSGYFIKLSKILPTSGHFPTQISILEALLRWLVGRLDPQVRRTAALTWFPRSLYQGTAVDLFLERTWTEFFKDARDFLNLQNAGSPGRVASTVCRQLTFGNMDIINGPQSRQTWLDVNAATRTVTITLDPRVIESFAATNYKNFETIMVAEENVFSVQLYRSSSLSGTKLSVHTLKPIQLAGSSARDLTAAISSRHLATLDVALRGIFKDKYRVLILNVDDVSTSPEEKKTETSNREVRSSDDIRRSNIPLRRRKQSGYAVQSRNPLEWKSPSTASTTSLAQLHQRLAALPPIYYTKEPVKICAQPELSMVREVSEGDDLSSRQSSITKSKQFGIYQASRVIDSDGNRIFFKQNDEPPATEQDKPVSSLLIATLGSADESFINDTFDKIKTNNANFDLVDLIVKEALENGPEEDSGITFEKKTEDSEVIENTPAEKQIRNKKLTRNRKAKCTIVSNSTTDESNTEPVIEVNEPCFVTDRRKKRNSKDNFDATSEKSKSFDAAAVDAFFSQHYTVNAAGSHVISPALARKLNETSSEGSGYDHNDVDEALIRNDLIFKQDIIDCLNNIVDEVCCKLDKYAEMLSKQQAQYDILEIAQNVDQDQNIDIKLDNPKINNNATPNDGTTLIALKYPKAKRRAPKKKTNQYDLKKDKKAGTVDLHEEENVVIEDSNTRSPLNKPNTSLIRKKRKLYSPKDDEKNEDEIPRAKVQSRQSTETPIATCYKELEIARKTRSRIPRKLRTSSTETSPKTKKLNDMFDKLKERVDNEETITLVKRKSNKKDLTVYNFTSDSEDEDFRKKTIEVQKRVSRTSLESTATKRGRTVNRINYSEGNHNSSSDEIKTNTKKRKIVKQAKPRSCKVKVEHTMDLTDERMREVPPEVLETSFVKESSAEKMVLDLEPTITHLPEVEIIPEDKNDVPTAITVPQNKSLRKKKAEILQIKKEKQPRNTIKKNTEIISIKKEKCENKKDMVEKIAKRTDSGSECSLPGLLVESEQPKQDVMSSSVEANLLQKFKKIRTEGPDVDESDATQNLLLRKDITENSHASNNDMNPDVCANFADLTMNEDVGNNFEIIDLNQNNMHSKDVTREPIILSESPSEKSIATDGKSPITGHNDLDELPPDMALLQENFADRDLEIQDMDKSMADFFVQLRTALRPGSSTNFMEKEETSELPFTRMSSKEQVESPKSSSKDKITPKSSMRTLKVVLPVDEIEKYVSPVKSQKSMASMSNVSVVLQRITSDEIDKWLPMPRANSNHSEEIAVKISNTRIPKKKPKRITKKTPEKKVKVKKNYTIISPVNLSFEVTNYAVSSNSSLKENVVEDLPKTRAKAKKLKILKPQETNIIIEEDTEIVEKNMTPENSSENVATEPIIQPASTVKDVFEKVRNVHTVAVTKNELENKEYTSESARSIASINEWFKKNMASSQHSSTKDKANHTMEDIIGKTIETLETTLTEIHQSTGKRLASMFLDNQRRLSSLTQELRTTDERINSELMDGVTKLIMEKSVERDLRFREMIAEFQKEQKECACDVVRLDRNQKILMVALLKEDLQAVRDFIDKQDKE